MTKVKNENLAYLMEPRFAFITFERRENALKALKHEPLSLTGDMIQAWIDE